MNANWDKLYIFTHKPFRQKYAPLVKHSVYFPSKMSVRLQFNSLEASECSLKLCSSFLINYLSKH